MVNILVVVKIILYYIYINILTNSRARRLCPVLALREVVIKTQPYNHIFLTRKKMLIGPFNPHHHRNVPPVNYSQT